MVKPSPTVRFAGGPPSPAVREREIAAEAIVVLGCRLRPDGTPSARLRERVALGVRLYRAGVAPRLLLSGGAGEAAAMRALARADGVPDAAMLCEEASRNTADNARFAARLLRPRGIARIVLVSDRTHLPRARSLFRLAGLAVVGSAGVPARSPAQAVVLALYEAAAVPRSIARVLRWRS